MVKPFSLPELTARIRAALRRTPKRSDNQLQVGDIRLDVAARRAYRGDKELKLSHKEFELLATLMRNKGACSPANISSARCGATTSTATCAQ